MNKKLRICIYGAASDKIDDIYKKETEEVGKFIAQSGHSLIYGAGSTGLMGACARGVVEEGGEVVGVTPHFMHDIEDVFDQCTELVNTQTMAERKTYMEDNADMFIIFPGGIGTFDEFFQVLTLRYLNRMNKLIVLYNINGYYDTIIKVIKEGIEKKFISPKVAEQFVVCSDKYEVRALWEEYASTL